MDINMIIANNILGILKKQSKKQMDLAKGVGVSKQAMSKMLSGGRTISAVELKQISSYLTVPMEKLMEIPDSFVEADLIHTFIGRVKTEQAEEALRIADEVSDLILFHRRVRENGIAMMQPGKK